MITLGFIAAGSVLGVLSTRFNEPVPAMIPPDSAVVNDRTPGHAVRYNGGFKISKKTNTPASQGVPPDSPVLTFR